MLVRRLDKAKFDALPDVMKAEYKVNPSDANEYLLDTDDANELKSARDREKERADKLQKQIDDSAKAIADAQALAEEERAKAAREKGDVKAIEATWQAKIDALIAEHGKAVEKLNGQLRRILVTKEAQRLAAEISTSPSLIAPIIERRLAANLSGEDPVTEVLDAVGASTKMTIDDLKKELVANPEYKAIIRASNASGGSADQQGGSGGSAPKKLSEMTGQERIALAASNPAEWQRVQDEARAAGNRNRLR